MDRSLCLTSCIFILLLAGCSKNHGSANPFEHATILDCNNLHIKKVELKETNGMKQFQISMENTCLSCNSSVYEGLYMIDKSTHDTIGFACTSCLATPPNKSVHTYELPSAVNDLPDLENIRFSMGAICTDVPYEP